MGKCDKKQHRTKEDARASGHRTTQGATSAPKASVVGDQQYSARSNTTTSYVG